jgi:hypothetical protein
MEESLTLSRTIRCAERLPGTSEASAVLGRQTSAAAEAVVELGENASLGRNHATMQTGQTELQESATLERWMVAIADTSPLTADESADLHRSGAIDLQAEYQVGEILAFSAGLLAAAEGLQEETETNESVALVRVDSLATTTSINASSNLTLDASVSTAAAGSLDDIQAAISLTRYSGTSPDSEYSFEETISANIYQKAEPSSLELIYDSVSLGALREGTWADQLLYNETLTLDGARQVDLLGWTSTDSGLLFVNCQNFSPTENISAMPRPDVFALEVDLLTSRTFTSLLKSQAKFVTSITTAKPMEYER